MIVHPNDQISAYLPCPLPLITSGAIQFGVPVNVLHSSLENVSFLLDPKSANLHIPLGSTRILAPFISLCTIPCLCKYSIPHNIYKVYFLTISSLNFPYLSNKLFIEPPDTYSKNKFICVDVYSTPKYLTILGCVNYDNTLISYSNESIFLLYIIYFILLIFI